MIRFNYIADFKLVTEKSIKNWVNSSVLNEEFKVGEINYIFCDDAYLLELNVNHLNHNTLTDIISFDDTLGKLVSGDIYISIERVKENAKEFKVSFEDELHRVMVHGILHFCKFNDKTEEEKELMRLKEDYYLSLRDF